MHLLQTFRKDEQRSTKTNVVYLEVILSGCQTLFLYRVKLVYIVQVQLSNNYLASNSVIVSETFSESSLPDAFLSEKLEFVCKKNPGLLG